MALRNNVPILHAYKQTMQIAREIVVAKSFLPIAAMMEIG